MGGGSQSSSQPYDELGGQYASFSGGTPGFDYSGLGLGVSKGLGQFGSGISSGAQAAAGTQRLSTPSFQQYTIPTNAQSQATLIPTNQSPEQQIMQIIQKLLGGSGGGY